MRRCPNKHCRLHLLQHFLADFRFDDSIEHQTVPLFCHNRGKSSCYCTKCSTKNLDWPTTCCWGCVLSDRSIQSISGFRHQEVKRITQMSRYITSARETWGNQHNNTALISRQQGQQSGAALQPGDIVSSACRQNIQLAYQIHCFPPLHILKLHFCIFTHTFPRWFEMKDYSSRPSVTYVSSLIKDTPRWQTSPLSHTRESARNQRVVSFLASSTSINCCPQFK